MTERRASQIRFVLVVVALVAIALLLAYGGA